MPGHARDQSGPDETGFTLIELLVGLILVGILAAISVPVFLHQRQAGWDSAVKTDLRNAEAAEEEWLTESRSYTNSIANLKSVGLKTGDGANYFSGVATITATFTGGEKVCMTAKSKSGTTFRFTDGGEYVATCP